MKKLVLFAAAGAIALGSVAAYAQMRHQGPMQHGPGDGQMGMMGPGMHMQHGPMMHGPMMSGGKHGHSMRGGMQHDGHGAGHADTTKVKGDTGPSSLAFNAINAKMHGAMDITFTGNADVDFVKGMIPHHEGAVDMAKTVLAFGKDPEIRKLADEIVRAQDKEIALMKAWLEKSPR